MDGSVTKRGKDSWRIQIYIGRDSNGKQKFKTKTIRGLKRVADAEKRKMLDDLSKGLYKQPQKLTLGQYMQQFLDTTGTLSYSPTTLHGYSEIINNHLIPKLGDLEIQKLTTADIRSYYAKALESGHCQKKGTGLSKQTLLHHHRLLHKILEQAIDDNIIAVNPVNRRIAPRVDDKQKMHIITPEEAESFLSVAQSCKYISCFKFALQTGMRRGEILGLKWADVNWSDKKISVNRSLTNVEGKSGTKSPKTHAGRRAVNLMAMTINLLQQIKEQQVMNKSLLVDAYVDNDYIFCEPNGESMQLDALTHSFMWYRNKAGLNITFHDLRHCHASWMLAAGVQPKVVSERLGHSSISITQDLYSHLLPTVQTSSVTRFEEMVGNTIA